MIVDGGKKYSVRLIPQTCNREEAIREIVNALDHLNAVSDEVFSTIRTRIGSHRKQLELLSNRVATASEQITSFKGSQKAIRITSPAKYPCETPNPTAKSFISQMTFPSLVSKNVQSSSVIGRSSENAEEMQCPRPFRFDSSIKHPNDLLSIFHVKETKLGDLNQLDNLADVGLGNPPVTIRNMDSFFLFNTIDNPYTNYKMTERSLQDRNFGTLKPTRKGEEVQVDAGPTVHLDSNSVEKKPEFDDFYYFPSAAEIPNIDVPESLPDLPGIADTFDLSDEPFTPVFPSKPFVLTSPPLQVSKSSPETISKAPSPEKEPVMAHPTSEPTSAPSVPTATPTAPPPPPPPPPLQLTDSIKAETKPVAPVPMGGDDIRSSLMAAIREAGGSGKARLKSAKDRKYEAKKKKQDEKEKSMANDFKEGENLIADLKNTLAMRRRGISGIQEGQKRAGVGDIMVSLAATIPTLDSSAEVSGTAGGSDEEDDWD